MSGGRPVDTAARCAPGSPERVTVLGAGSWGTALAWLLGEKGAHVSLWCRDPERAAEIQAVRRNARYLPDTCLPDMVHVTTDLAGALEEADLAVVAVPAQSVRAVLTTAWPRMKRRVPLVIAAKGLEVETGLRLSEVAAEVRATGESEVQGGESGGPGSGLNALDSGLVSSPMAAEGGLAVLSGPNLSGELVRKIPSTTVIATADPELGQRVQSLLSTAFLRVYTNPDIIGVELGGALKNIVALGAGISDGLGFGDNTKAALITRGLAEMVRLGVRCGARAATFAGLTGLGDLVATCGSRLSRNHALGVRLGQGETLETALSALGQVAESVPTTAAAHRLAHEHGIEMPITEEIYRVLYEGQSPAAAVHSLMSRAFRDE